MAFVRVEIFPKAPSIRRGTQSVLRVMMMI